MFRIDNSSAVANMPAPAAAGTPGYFSEGNPAAGEAATIVSGDWLNIVQEEIAAPIEETGGTLDKTNPHQLLAAIKSLIGTGVVASFAGSLGATGWVKLPFGLILQWGQATLPVASATISTASVSLPVAFPNACAVAIGNAGRAASSAHGYYPSITTATLAAGTFNLIGDTLSGGQSNVVNFDQTVPVSWFAIGY
ncbi:gp53-like domain-containing protein [Kozakia baliensis]|uniref:Putative tail fiber protein gp53-like C-terminal domain-containing protein n=1 Tax=Kozakia baliensis TaxID=153496 RepID=A0A1D8UTD1_9PROT|nr:hypothetical protein [Kozakia baliensis]AOX16911.1 hypothetical protein A0U89_06930 [Kozakia baliensis]GBR25626.1 hypothetical protein AA0488_0699 [Kozakia baliensis NRIC 0488]GEL64042.1 hypothetical protein KBA01_13280 [Kozakia baliensis]